MNWLRISITAAFALTIGVLLWAAFHYYGKTISQQSEISVATQAKNQAEFITKTQALSVTIFNTIAGATLDEQKTNVASSQARQVIIKTVLQTEPCAVVVVPASVNDQLLTHYNSIRSGAGNSDTSQPSPVLPAVASTK
ncbi:hypothetical protein M2403_002031 [Rahnella sp. BIGb0603]|uniref:hypothetical protein n=1 Tax=Rahnella sp. BIGb0603 TaxID=2940612 RepID=UPI0021690D81|nr:hypothetical protein [Rahnella sp. BIGb0603]MCS3423430.1 hypothetical protein [Rahnella sp. BIGb0603]